MTTWWSRFNLEIIGHDEIKMCIVLAYTDAKKNEWILYHISIERKLHSVINIHNSYVQNPYI